MSEKLEALRNHIRDKSSTELTNSEREHWQNTLNNFDENITLQINRQNLSKESLKRIIYDI